MKILIIYQCDNGYSCSCCGQSWREIKVYELLEGLSVDEFIEQIKAEIKANYDEDSYGRHSVIGAYTIDETIIEYK